jgi:hypothetical protein
MEEKELKERCERIFDLFDRLNIESTYGEDIPIRNLISSEEFYNELHLLTPSDDSMFDDIIDLLWKRIEIAFALGFVIGKDFDLTYPEAQADIEYIRKVIKEEGLLPYLPREKKV